MFARLFVRLLGKRRRILAAALSLVVIAFYAVLVGAGASVVRAALMGGLSLFAVQIGRRQDGLNSLAFVAALMALINPNVLWDVGFQLSFMATLGLVLYAGPLSQAFTRLASRRLPQATLERLTRPVGEYLLFTLAATVTTLPITAYHFQRISLTAFLANPLVLPAQPPVMVLGGLAVLVGTIFQPIGQYLAYLAWPFVAYTIRAVELVASIPAGVVVFGRVALAWALGYYGVLFLVTFAGSRLRSLGGLVKPSAALVALAALTVVVWRAALSAPDGRLHLTVLDVGSGDALLVQSPTGRYVLIDSGPSPGKLSDALGRRLPLFHRQLDYLVVAAPGAEQVAALPQVLPRFPVREVLWGGPAGTGTAARSLQAYLTQAGIQPVSAQPGQALDLGNGAALRVLEVGNGGAALLLEWRKFRALLPVGMDEAMLKTLLDDSALVPVNALLLADRGSAELNPPEWLAKIHPQVLLLSVGAGDQDGRPDRLLLVALEGYTLLRTDQNGWIELTTDGEQMWVEAEKK